MATKTCLNCGNEVVEKARFCNQCGKSEFGTPERCQYCNEAIPVNSNLKFCPNCGKRIKEGEVKRKRIIAVGGTVHTCNICLGEIESDIAICPSCLNTFHFNHLSNWILEKGQCPICQTKLEFQ